MTRSLPAIPRSSAAAVEAATALARVRIVLVRTSLAANIGAAARAMLTMGLDRLVLVAPAQFPHSDATALATGATRILETARVVRTRRAAPRESRRKVRGEWPD